MYIRHSGKYQKDIKIIHPGEYYISNEDELIGTLLGSCVSVCLFDEESAIAGMNHFMLPGKISHTDMFTDKSARYGIIAINDLVHGMVESGAGRNRIKAKIFGGGHVLDTKTISIPNDNIRLAKAMMEMEDIPIVKVDVGMNYTRKILFEVKTGKVFLKKSTRADVIKKVFKEEKEFAKRRFKNVKG